MNPPRERRLCITSRRLVFAALLVTSASLGAACSHDEPPSDPPPSGEAWPIDGPARLVVDTPTRTDAFATRDEYVTLTGVAWGRVDRVEIRVNGGDPVVAAGLPEWSQDIPLALGTTMIEVTAVSPIASRARTITVVRTQAVEFPSAVRVSPPWAFVGSPRSVVVTAAVGGAFDPASVTLVRVDDQGHATPVGALRDDGTDGDEAADDGVFSGVATIDEPAAVQARFAVEAAAPGGLVERSAAALLDVVKRRPPSDMEALEAVSNLGRAVFYQHFDGTDAARAPAVDAVVAALEADDRVGRVERSGAAVMITLVSGLVTRLSFEPPGTLSGGAPDDCVHALRVSPFDFSLNPIGGSAMDPLRNDLSQCAPPFEVTEWVTTKTAGVINIGAGVPEFERLHDRDLIVIDTHGTEWSDPQSPEPSVDVLGVVLRWCGSYVVGMAPPDCALSSELEDLRDGLTRIPPPPAPAVPEAYVVEADEPSDAQLGATVQRWTGLVLTPAFFRHRQLRTGAAVFASACKSFSNDTLAEAFFSAGAGAYLGYDENVITSFARAQVSKWNTCMAIPGGTPSGCYTGQHLDTEVDDKFTKSVGAQLRMLSRNGGGSRVLCDFEP